MSRRLHRCDPPVQPLSFRCTSCGNCCRSLRVAVTALDIARLSRAIARPAAELVEWLGPNDVDLWHDAASVVELREGRRLLVLAQQRGACVLLGADQLCTAYAARPRDCRAYPFHFEPRTDERRYLTLLPLSGCDYAEDGRNQERALAEEDAQRARELVDYQRWVQAWNRQTWHRRRLHKSVGSAAQFLELSVGRLLGTDAE